MYQHSIGFLTMYGQGSMLCYKALYMLLKYFPANELEMKVPSVISQQ